MSQRKLVKVESLRVKAQDQESDSNQIEKKKTTNQGQDGVKPPSARSKNVSDPEKLQGRQIQPSRNGNHPLPKRKDPVRIPFRPKPGSVRQPIKKGSLTNVRTRQGPINSVAQKRAPTNKSNKGPNSIVHNGAMKMPKAQREQNHDQIQNRLKKKSPWYQSLRSPVDNAGVKIPDPVGTETGTYQHIQNVAVAVNDQGMAGLRVTSPYINSAGGADGQNYQITTKDAAPLAMIWGDTLNIPGATIPFQKVPPLMKSNARSHRVVSACVMAQSEVSSLNDQGEAVAFVTPFGANSSTTPYNEYTEQYDSTIVPVNAHLPIAARWYPLEAEAPAFVTGNPSDEWGIVSYHDFINPNDSTFAGQEDATIPWEFGVLFTGCGAGVVRFQICINYELIPLFSTTMVTSTPSPVDEVEESLVNKWVGDAPATEVVSQRAISVAPSASNVDDVNNVTGMGMLASVIQEVIPFALKAGAMLL